MDDTAAWLSEFEGRARRNLGRLMFVARWIMAPLYFGLLAGLLLLVAKFIQVLVQAVPQLLSQTSNETIYAVLTLVDLSLVANLVVIVIFAGWENFVGRLLEGAASERPAWLGGLDHRHRPARSAHRAPAPVSPGQGGRRLDLRRRRALCRDRGEALLAHR